MQIFVYGETAEPLTSPVTGQYIVDLQLGDTVEVVMQNLPGNSSGAKLAIILVRSDIIRHILHIEALLI